MKRGIFLIVFFAIFLSAIIVLSLASSFSNRYDFISEEQIIDMCSNLDFEGKVDCLNGFVIANFKYKGDSKGVLSVAELFENGGRCYNYAKFYENMSKRLGLYAKEVGFGIGNSAHSIVIVSDKESNKYCVLDMKDKWCREME